MDEDELFFEFSTLDRKVQDVLLATRTYVELLKGIHMQTPMINEFLAKKTYDATLQNTDFDNPVVRQQFIERVHKYAKKGVVNEAGEFVDSVVDAADLLTAVNRVIAKWDLALTENRTELESYGERFLLIQDQNRLKAYAQRAIEERVRKAAKKYRKIVKDEAEMEGLSVDDYDLGAADVQAMVDNAQFIKTARPAVLDDF